MAFGMRLGSFTSVPNVCFLRLFQRLFALLRIDENPLGDSILAAVNQLALQQHDECHELQNP